MCDRFVLLFLALTLPALMLECSRAPEVDAVAIVNGQPLSVKEYRTRFEFTPHAANFAKLQDKKEWVLRNLLAEKVLAHAARKEGLHKRPRLRALAEQMEKEAVIEVLFDEVLAPGVEMTGEELREAYIRSTQTLQVQYLEFADAGAARKARMDMALPDSSDRAAAWTRVPGTEMKWGSFPPEIEDAAFSLRVGDISPVVKADGSYWLLRLVARTANPLLTESEYRYRRPSLTKTIRRRKLARMYQSYVADLMSTRRLTVRKAIFNSVADVLEELLAVGIDDEAPWLGKHRPIDEVVYLASRDRLRASWDEPFATFEDGESWTVGQFLSRLRAGPYPLDRRSPEALRRSLRLMIRRMAELEAVAQEGFRRGLRSHPRVRSEVAMWTDSFLAAEVLIGMSDSVVVSEDEALRYYHENQGAYRTPKGGRRPFDEVQEEIISSLKSERIAAAIKSRLAEAARNAVIEFRTDVLDTLTVVDANMLVTKLHFPGRTIAPFVHPLPGVEEVEGFRAPE